MRVNSRVVRPLVLGAVALPIAAATFTAAELDAFNRASTWDNDESGDMFSDLS